MIKSFLSINKKKRKNKISINKCIKEFIRLENTVTDFYDYKKTIAKMKRDEIKKKIITKEFSILLKEAPKTS
jgi:poly(A) polymerase Pap1|tara:strand:+ start:710 stop:925 length:216 start_codon:yes stop_codon:yes gene_type:complete